MLLAAAASGNGQMFQAEDQPEELAAQAPYATTDFYLYPLAVASNLFNAVLYGTANGSNYLITSTEALDPATNSVWLAEGTLQGGTDDGTQFALGVALRTNNLFIRAQACDDACSAANLPLAWQLNYFGVTGVDPTADYDNDGVNNLAEFLGGTDPNKIAFSLSVSNQYVAASAVPVQVNLARGVPSYIAVLLNDSPANASWQPFTSTNLSVALPTNGTYVITVGLSGLATNATQSFQTVTVFCDTTPLTLAFTNLPAFSGSRPFIDPAGYTTRALSALTWTVVDATGATNTGDGMVVAQGWSLADPYHVTNWFQCVDLALALGTNWVSIQAVDWAGAVALTNFAYVFDTNGDITPPALTLTWPQDGTQVSGDTFTVQAWMDDDTAAVALQYTDTNGMVQTVNGQVERGGNVWVPNVPLAAGTNGFTLLATDAAGNVSTNNFSVVQSSVGLTINPLSQDQMKYGYVDGHRGGWRPGLHDHRQRSARGQLWRRHLGSGQCAPAAGRVDRAASHRPVRRAVAAKPERQLRAAAQSSGGTSGPGAARSSPWARLCSPKRTITPWATPSFPAPTPLRAIASHCTGRAELAAATRNHPGPWTRTGTSQAMYS